MRLVALIFVSVCLGAGAVSMTAHWLGRATAVFNQALAAPAGDARS
jgi:hypothetical protein